MEKDNALEEGITLAKNGEYKKALNIFEEDLQFTKNPTIMSYYAFCLAAVEKKFEQAISLCLMAIEREFFNPDIYLNLGKVYMVNGQKAIAIKAFRKGLSIDNTHPELIKEIKGMGIRRKPIISFLHRKNIVNKHLGTLASMWNSRGVLANSNA
ncbi:MAG: hypothetical protein V3T96_00580 [Thermodesulfobacteriota bacterium]